MARYLVSTISRQLALAGVPPEGNHFWTWTQYPSGGFSFTGWGYAPRRKKNTMPDANLLFRPERDRKAYRLRCHFRIEAYPQPAYVDRMKVTVAERFVRDMHLQGWEYVSRYGFTLRGPLVSLRPVELRLTGAPTSRQMLDGVAGGARFRADPREVQAEMAPVLAESEYWEYELAGVFIRSALAMEIPDAHEESWI